MAGSSDWKLKQEALLRRAKQLKHEVVVDYAALLELRRQIDELARDPERAGISDEQSPGLARVVPEPTQPVGRAPTRPHFDRPPPRCPFGRCDGSKWLLHESEDVAEPCVCQKLPRDREAKRQTRRVLRKHLALGLDAPPLSDLDPRMREALHGYQAGLTRRVKEGSGMWACGYRSEDGDAIAAFLAGEAWRHSKGALIYPGDELVGRLRRLAAIDQARLEKEIYTRLPSVELLIISGFDQALAPSRYPEPPREEGPRENCDPDGRGDGGETPRATVAERYLPGLTDPELDRLSEIINERLLAQRATIITTDCSPELLEERMTMIPGDCGDDPVFRQAERRRRVIRATRVLSRLNELCGTPICLPSPDDSVRRPQKTLTDAAA